MLIVTTTNAEFFRKEITHKNSSENIRWFYITSGTFSKIEKKHSKMSQVEGAQESFCLVIIGVIPRVLQNIMRKYRVSQDMEKYPKWTKKYLKITPRRRQHAIIFSLFVTVTVIAIR